MLSAAFPQVGIGLLGVSLSGCHLNPVVVNGLETLRRRCWVGFDINGGLASNGFDAPSLGGDTMMAGLTVGRARTFYFQLSIMGATDNGRRAG